MYAIRSYYGAHRSSSSAASEKHFKNVSEPAEVRTPEDVLCTVLIINSGVPETVVLSPFFRV